MPARSRMLAGEVKKGCVKAHNAQQRNRTKSCFDFKNTCMRKLITHAKYMYSLHIVLYCTGANVDILYACADVEMISSIDRC